jgi:hypothetical protein
VPPPPPDEAGRAARRRAHRAARPHRRELDLARGAASRTDDGATGEIRRAVTDLVGSIARHRQAGSDLVFEAYEVDIGAGD